MNKKSLIFSLITCCSLLFSTSCSNNSQSQVIDELVVRYENYVNNGGELTYDEWLKVIEDPELNNENYDAPYIGSNGNWYVNGLDTGVKASGDDGTSITIVSTSSEVDGNVTYTKIEFSDGSIIKIPNGKDGQDGKDGITPIIKDGYWYIGDLNTGIKAEGSDGFSIYITDTEQTVEENISYTIVYFSDGTSIKIPNGTNGQDGEDGLTPYIKDGFWFVGESNTGIKAVGEDGVSISITDVKQEVGEDGNIYTVIYFSDETSIKIPNGVNGQDGEDGLTPYIKDDYWYIGELNTNVKANGEDGNSITILSVGEETSDDLTYTVIYFSDDTNIKIPNGKDGQDGIDGYTPYIQDGYWYINGESTGVTAKGDEVEMRINEGNIEWKTSSSSDWNILISVNILKGNDGLNGKSAYEIYKQYCNYEGSEEEWINDLVNGLLHFDDPGIIDYIPAYRMRVTVGEPINLPTRINAIYSNGLVEEVNVRWNKSNLDSNYVGEKKILGYVENYQEKVECYVYVSRYTTTEKYIDGYVNGIQDDDNITVTLFNDSYVRTITPSITGYYKFSDLMDGNYYIKIDANGYEAVELNSASISSVTVDSSTLYSNVSHVNFNLKTLRENGYYSCWQSTETGFTYETVSNVNKEIKVDFAEDSSEVSDDGAASILREKYNVVLLNDEEKWSSETSSRFLELYQTIPDSITTNLKSTWKLTNKHINNDIIINQVDDHYEITISIDAIENSTPRVATIDGQVGKYYSKRLYNAIVRFVTNNGYDANACETILNTNFLCSFNVPDYAYLTEGITNETEVSFQEFLPDEKLLILTMFEEMPEGMHKMKELKYLVRRKTGQTHPIYPQAAAVTWTKAREPYIEFMDSAFKDDQGYYETKRLIIHEKTHMYYEYYFSNELKEQWYEIGGWYQSADDPDGWKTTKETEFVSAYAHEHNPDEDMAESVATYVINPNLLKSRSINKYNFIKNYIMNGSYYILETREDLKFEVYNLSPDYIYPGKVKSTIIKITGDYFDDKTIDIRFKLFGNDSTNGANNFWLRSSPYGVKSTQYYDMSGRRVDDFGLELQGSTRLSKYSYQGYWFTDQLTLADFVGNERYVNGLDIGFKFYLDNPLCDMEESKLVKNSLNLTIENANNSEHPNEQVLIVRFKATDNIGIDRALVRLVCLQKNKESIDVYAQYINNETNEIEARITIPEHYSTGTYEIAEISLWDFANNYYFEHVNYGGLQGENNQIEITTLNPDNEGPTMDENNISVEAVPSIPEAPNGETFVTLKLRVKDNISGFKIGYVRILDPQGLKHGYWLYPPVYSGYYFDGDPTVEAEYTFKLTLPEGSAPGTWSIYEISLNDFALNTTVYDFTEIIHFDVNN